MTLIATTDFLYALMNYMTGQATPPNPMATLYLGLLVGSARLAPSTKMMQVAEPAFPGYGRLAVDHTKWGLPSVEPDGTLLSVNTAALSFRMTDDTTPATITGIFLASGIDDTALLYASAAFDAPYQLVSSKQALSVVPVISLPALLAIGSPPILG